MRTLTSLFCALVVTTTCLALPPQLIYNNVDTNAIGTAPDGYVLTEQNLKPVWAPNAGGGGGGGTNVTINFYTVITTNIISVTNVSLYTITTNIFATTNILTYITNFTLITTNITVEQPGGFTNLNLIPGTVMVTDTNDAESSLPNGVGVLTNNGVNFGWSRSLILDEIDVGTGYFSNSFFFHTNWPFIGLDGNGQIFQSDNPTNNDLSISNALYLQIAGGTNSVLPPNALGALTNNASGGLGWYNLLALLSLATNNDTLVSNALYLTFNSGTNNLLPANALGALTNNGSGTYGWYDLLAILVNATNYTDRATNRAVTFSGTANQISGGGATFLGGSATPFAITSPLLAPGAVRVTGFTNTSNTLLQGTETNSSMGTGIIHSDSLGGRSSSALSPTDMANTGTAGTYRSVTFNAQGLETSGSNPTTFSGYAISDTSANFLSSLTDDAIIQFDTNAIPSSGALTFRHSYDTNLQADIVLPAFTLDATKYETLVLTVTNSTAAVHTVQMPAGVRIAVANGGGNKFYCTNALITEIWVTHDGLKWTNSFKNEF